jgi:ppGpp synthetase/RelA/SpoT-type nucleotidyltranferase
MTLLRSLEVEIMHKCRRSRRAIPVVRFRRRISIIVTIRIMVVLLSLEVLEVVLEVVLEMALFGIELLSSQD